MSILIQTEKTFDPLTFNSGVQIQIIRCSDEILKFSRSRIEDTCQTTIDYDINFDASFSEEAIKYFFRLLYGLQLSIDLQTLYDVWRVADLLRYRRTHEVFQV